MVPSTEAILSLVGLGLICTAIAFVLLFALIVEVGASRALVFHLRHHPVVALGLGIVILGERPGIGAIVGLVPDPRRLVALYARRTARARPSPATGRIVASRAGSFTNRSLNARIAAMCSALHGPDGSPVATVPGHEDVVGDDHAAHAQVGHDAVQVRGVLLLDAVDEREVDRDVDAGEPLARVLEAESNFSATPARSR